MINVQEIINLLKLEPLPQEGGYFRQTYKSSETIPQAALPLRYRQDRTFGTAIYFMLTSADFSAMHRLDTDEIYHFYLGDPLEMLLLHPDGSGEVFILGNDLLKGMQPQKVVPKEVWQGSRLTPGGQCGFALVGTTMAPGFEWAGFELGEREALIEQYPAFAQMIAARAH
jgi:predicted cupin superfamily sugar epimerase